MEDVQAMSARLPVSLHEELRLEAFERRVPMNTILVESVAAHVAARKAGVKPGDWIIHKDGDPANNDLDNLEVVRPSRAKAALAAGEEGK